MKKLIIVLIIGFILVASPVLALTSCGIKPISRIGCHSVCVCDSLGNNCQWVQVCR